MATLAVCVFTMVPTAFVATMAWRINRPGHIRDVEIELGRQLGLQVTLDGVRYPRPGEILYQGIVVRQEEPRNKGLSEILRADEIRLQRADRELTLQLVNPRLRGDSPKAAMSQVGILLQRSGQVPFDRVSVTAATCQLDLGRDDLHFTVQDLAGEFSVDPSLPTAKLAFRMPSATSSTRCELTLSRDRRSEPLVTSLSLRTVEGLPLSARVLNMFFETESWLGPDATVEGTLSLRQTGSKDWQAEFQGSLLDVDLAKVIGRRFPRHRLAGRSRLVVEKARWGERPAQGPGWIEVKANLLAGQGSIGMNLLEALAREMKFRLPSRVARLDARRTEVDFRALGLAFEMQSNGDIQIGGSLGAEFPPDAILAGATTALLSAPRGTASVHGLIKTLFPESSANPGVLVPLTAESQVLLSLPVPAESIQRGKSTLDGN
jgi:hypothetical protein